jgi:hypothetical protein
MQSMAKRCVGLMMLFKANRLCIRLRPGCAFIASGVFHIATQTRDNEHRTQADLHPAWIIHDGCRFK